ncbi:MAG TPA: bifunctional 4-hydroxy-2-oxoglutarate aldolase/2-dehydro-3-deoxy-phosphogluconate aldolase [Microbacteriaceae bacterium]|nr:bifunctional 4-hydroxy-2-oxoglutarate aldolase/2-dehydro-3-deoxy-phosphogluconate aldolase [Microbacteriaceae bacterium]
MDSTLSKAASSAAAAIRETKTIAIIREKSEEAARQEATRLLGCGVRVVEVSLVTPGALDVLRWMNDSLHSAGRHFGAGTVLTADDARAAKKAGAEFIVSPISSLALLGAAHEAGMTSVVGALTPTECHEAATGGADFVKLFPASLWSPKDMKGLLQALPTLRLVPTGGVTLDSATRWIEAGAVALGLGGTLRRAGDAAVAALLADLAATSVG